MPLYPSPPLVRRPESPPISLDSCPPFDRTLPPRLRILPGPGAGYWFQFLNWIQFQDLDTIPEATRPGTVQGLDTIPGGRYNSRGWIQFQGVDTIPGAGYNSRGRRARCSLRAGYNSRGWIQFQGLDTIPGDGYNSRGWIQFQRPQGQVQFQGWIQFQGLVQSKATSSRRAYACGI